MAQSFIQVHKETSPYRIYDRNYKSARSNLLMVVIFTVINLVLLVTNSDSYFLFSAFIPYFIATMGMLLCGRFPEEYYTDGLEDIVFLDNSVFVVLLIISIVLTLFYLLAWLMSSKQRVGWLIFALVYFGIDTIGMLLINGISLEAAFDIVFHGLIIYYLSVGIRAHFKLKKLPPEGATEVSFGENPQQAEPNGENPEEGIPEEGIEEAQNSEILRKADKDVKCKVLLEKRIFNYDITYRRVKRTNELVINGNVYDEFVGLVEPAHKLNALIDGHRIEAIFTGTHSVITFDGQEIAKKLRLI